MTKSMTILAITVAFVAGSIISGVIAFADKDDGKGNLIVNAINALTDAIQGIETTVNVDTTPITVNVEPTPIIINAQQGPTGPSGPQGPPGESSITKIIHLEPIVCGSSEVIGSVLVNIGWCPDKDFPNKRYFIEDVDVTENSVIVVTLDSALNFGPSCKVMQLISDEGFLLRCNDRDSPTFEIPSNTNLNYALMNP